MDRDDKLIAEYERARRNRYILWAVVAAMGLVGVSWWWFLPMLAPGAELNAQVDHTRGGIACGVHYETDLANATKRFDEVFQGVKNVTIAAEWEPGQSNYNCNAMREKVRELDREGACLSYYSGDVDFSDAKCRVYRFDYDRYIGPIGDLGRR